jgi:Protein of unknown function (DUF1574)
MSYVELKEKNRQANLQLEENPRLLGSRPRQSWPVPVIFTSSAIAALLFFAGIDLCLRFCFHPDVYQLPNHTFIWWTVSDYRKLRQPPETLIFGSSLMIAAVDQGDATYIDNSIDSAIHHHSLCLTDNLNQKIGGHHTNFSFAVGGQMASDVYAISQTLINATNHPKLIIWGIAPRDFLDSAFREPIASDTAQYMNKIGQRKTIAPQHTSLPFYIEEGLLHICQLFANKENFIASKNEMLREFIKQISTKLTLNRNKNVSVESQVVSTENLDIGERIVWPCKASSAQLVDNTKEYRMRYNPFNSRSFYQQLQFCEKFLDQADKLGIKVLFVNMPITSRNMSLLPPGVYNLYLNKVRQIAQNHGEHFYDLNGDSHFSERDFTDTVHLNGIGGRKFVELLSSHIQSDHILQ